MGVLSLNQSAKPHKPNPFLRWLLFKDDSSIYHWFDFTGVFLAPAPSFQSLLSLSRVLGSAVPKSHTS